MLNQSLITVLIVDDHAIVREGLKIALQNIPEIKVIGEASNGEEALDIARKIKPRVVLMDIKMPGIGGLEASRRILQHHPNTKIIILTSVEDDTFFAWSKEIGIQGYLTKEANMNELIQAIKKVHQGEIYIMEEILNQVIQKTFAKKETPFANLTVRELEVIFLLCSGMKVKEIAERLFISTKTVNSYRYKLFEKLNVQNDVELTHLAIKHGLINQVNS